MAKRAPLRHVVACPSATEAVGTFVRLSDGADDARLVDGDHTPSAADERLVELVVLSAAMIFRSTQPEAADVDSPSPIGKESARRF